MADKEYYSFKSNRIQINWRKLRDIAQKFADKMFMKQKLTKIENRNQMSDEKL